MSKTAYFNGPEDSNTQYVDQTENSISSELENYNLNNQVPDGTLLSGKNDIRDFYTAANSPVQYGAFTCNTKRLAGNYPAVVKSKSITRWFDVQCVDRFNQTGVAPAVVLYGGTVVNILASACRCEKQDCKDREYHAVKSFNDVCFVLEADVTIQTPQPT